MTSSETRSFYRPHTCAFPRDSVLCCHTVQAHLPYQSTRSKIVWQGCTLSPPEGSRVRAQGTGTASCLDMKAVQQKYEGCFAYLGPAVPLGFVLVVGIAGLQHGLLCTPAAGHLADHGAACAGDHLSSTSHHQPHSIVFCSCAMMHSMCRWPGAPMRILCIIKSSALAYRCSWQALQQACLLSKKYITDGAACYLLGSRGQLDAGDAGLWVVRHHDGIVS